MTWIPQVREVMWHGEKRYEASITDGRTRLYVVYYSNSLQTQSAIIRGDTYAWRRSAVRAARRAAKRRGLTHYTNTEWTGV